MAWLYMWMPRSVHHFGAIDHVTSRSLSWLDGWTVAFVFGETQ